MTADGKSEHRWSVMLTLTIATMFASVTGSAALEPAVMTPQLAQADSFYDSQDIPIYTRNWVSELQSRLKQAGFDPGTDSGAFTEKTRDTIKEFQSRNGLTVNGQPTPSVMRKLRSTELQPGQSG
jgi:peptidoglycan hydrolase-like protein with peptidoglycan-binding domain